MCIARSHCTFPSPGREKSKLHALTLQSLTECTQHHDSLEFDEKT